MREKFKEATQNYLQELQVQINAGDFREESFYPALKRFLESFAQGSELSSIHITALPKKTEVGNPDFRIWDGKSEIIGYIEAKSPEKNLDQVQDSEQLKRYSETFPNLILTNFYEFWLFREGKIIEKVLIARPVIAKKLQTAPPIEKELEFYSLLEKFFAFHTPRVFSAKSLAKELAVRTRWLKQVINEQLEKADPDLTGFYQSFDQFLIGGIKKEQFADLYAQTVTYGLFTARIQTKSEFTRTNAYNQIPESLGILRDIFRYISMTELPEPMKWPLDDIIAILKNADLNQIINEFYHPKFQTLPFANQELEKALRPEEKIKDPIFHFYETFLAEYDPEEREKRGVYYTPQPVISFIVRSLNLVLKEVFQRKDGFADPSVTVLDPAAGTLSFMVSAAKTAIEEYQEKYGSGGIKEFIREHLLKNFYAFELMMAPYAVGHLKIGFLLNEYDYQFKAKERFRFYLTNTLELEELPESKFPFLRSLSEENHQAFEVKKKTPILVILGNPPYSGISANTGKWITGKIEDYKYVDGEHFGERKHWLQDDYVKFIRFAQWKLDEVGEGVIGFITNHAYLDNPTFRGMRQSLMNSFDRIYILNLHGNSLKKEICPDGSKDENVFDIRQGVAIGIFVKVKKTKKQKPEIFYADLWGLRKKKGEKLLQNDIKTIKWKKLSPKSPYYFFVPFEEKGSKVYNKFWKITDIFPVNVTGIVTARDHFVIDFEKNNLKRNILMFRNLSISDNEIRCSFKLKDTRGWKLSEARKKLNQDQNWDKYFTKILYRPFDIRNIYYTPQMIDWPRPEVMRHMMTGNLGLITCRQQNKLGFHHCFISDKIIESCVVSNQTKEIGYLFPLYIYSNSTLNNDGKPLETKSREPNLAPEIISALKNSLNKKITPEQIFYYIYAVLYAPAYRQKYAEFLKIDFPKIPFTSDYNIFKKMAELGEKLVQLHLLKSSLLDKPVARFEGKGDNKIERPEYNKKEKRIYINNTQYFEGIDPEVWDYQIGGYQVLYQWLKYRKGRKLVLEEIQHFSKTATALKKTIEIQEQINKTYPEIENNLIGNQGEDP